MKHCFLFVFFVSCIITSQSQVDDYINKYRKDCENTKAFFAEHKDEFSDAASICGLSAEFLFAIVAPEISQFSYLQDKAETYALKVFYVQNGKDYSDFSIGLFQMKPSFIESLENYISANTELKNKFQKFLFTKPDERQARVERIERLSSLQWQIEYLALFCVVVNHKFMNATFSTDEKKLRFYANAYNSGFHRSEEALKSVKGAYFPHLSKTKYRYMDISVWFYNEVLKE